MKKRVALFINSLCGGGAERVISRISGGLSEKYELYIFLIDGNNKFYECAGEIIDLGVGSDKYVFNAIKAIFQFPKMIKKYRIDCVISFLIIPNILNCLLNRHAVKMISIRDYTNSKMCKTWMEKIKYYFCKKCYKVADKVISVSKELNIETIKDYNISKSRACVIENPYDVVEIKQRASEEIESDIYDFITQNRTAVAVGRLDEQKGYIELINTFSKVYNERPDAALIILGEGAQRKELQRLICEKKLEERIRLLGTCKNPFAYISRCQLYVSTSRHEGFPNTLVEAMACGVPVIHADCKTGPREILCKQSGGLTHSEKLIGDYGILIPSYTRDEISEEEMKTLFSNAWLELLSSDDKREYYAAKALERAKYYSVSSCIEKFVDLIEDVLNANNGKGKC